MNIRKSSFSIFSMRLFSSGIFCKFNNISEFNNKSSFCIKKSSIELSNTLLSVKNSFKAFILEIKDD